MDALMKILLTDEKKMSQLTVRYNALKKNIDNETPAEKELRKHLGVDIAAIRKTNAVIISHCLHERRLSPEEITKIMNTHSD